MLHIMCAALAMLAYAGKAPVLLLVAFVAALGLFVLAIAVGLSVLNVPAKPTSAPETSAAVALVERAGRDVSMAQMGAVDGQ